MRLANFIVVVGLLVLFMSKLERALAYGIITTLKSDLAGDVRSVFKHANGVYYVGVNIYHVRLINSTSNEDIAVVGTGHCCFGGDGGPALSATMHWSFDVYVTASGEIYFTEHEGFRVRYVDTAGIISTVAGTGNQGYSSTPTLAVNADLYHPIGLVLDQSENIYIADLCAIRKVTRSTGMISTIAGSSASDCGYSGEGDMLAINAKINIGTYLDLDSDENIIFADHGNQLIRKIFKQSGKITTIVSGTGCYTMGVSVDRSTNDVYFSDNCQRVFRSSKMYNSDSYGAFELAAGGNGRGYSGDGEDANSAQIIPHNVEFDYSSTNGAFLIADNHNRAIRSVTNPCELGSELFGSGCWCSRGYYSDNGMSPCNQCDYGSSSDRIGGRISDCQCQNGFYSSTGFSPCDACHDNTESKIPVGAKSCSCSPGYTGQGDEVPSDILEGTGRWEYDKFVRLHEFYAAHSFSAPCVECPVNSGTWDVAASPTSLKESQGNKCLCDPDTKSATGFGPCEPCAEGSGSLHIFEDWFNVKSTQMTKCFCKAGYYSPDGSDSGGDCAVCPHGKVSLNTDLLYHSYYNHLLEPLNTRCLCQRNYYKNNTITSIESSSDCIQCPEGAATTGYDGTACTICDIGYYSPSGFYPCDKCADGKTTNGYQQTSCTVTSTFAPTPGPTPSPTPSSPSVTNPPVAHPTRAPVQTKRPTAHPTMRPSQASECPKGFFSNTGFSPDCQACPLGTTNVESGSTSCDACEVGYYGVAGQTPCYACPEMYTSNEMRTSCYLCIGFDQGCSFNGGTINNGNGDTVDEQISSFNKTFREYIDDIYSEIREIKDGNGDIVDDQISSFNKTILEYIDDLYSGMSILEKRIRKLKKRGLMVSDEQALP